MSDDTWPKHPDGRNKKMGEMTQDERRAQWKTAGARVMGNFQRPDVQAGFTAVFASDTSLPN
jgi:hypothetical protein